MKRTDTRSLTYRALAVIAERAGAHAILLGEFLDHPLPRVRTLCCVEAGALVENFSYRTAGDPAAELATAGSLQIASTVQARYPTSYLLQDFAADAYAAHRVKFGSSGKQGIVALFWQQAPSSMPAAQIALADFAATFAEQQESWQLEIERERANYMTEVYNTFFRQYEQDNPEAISFSEMMPPVPLDLPHDALLERLMHTGHVIECNKAMARLYGYPDAESLHGATPYELNGPEKAPRVSAYWAANNYHLRNVESQSVDAEGNITWIRGTVIGQITQGKLTHFWAKRADMTAQKRYEAAIQHKAHHDALTGLPNRYWFQERIAALVSDHGARGKQFCLGLLDLNGFKEINDTLGHVLGDHILEAVAVRLLKGLKPHDAELARLGGDEFAILLPEVNDPARCEAMAHTLEQLLAQFFVIEDMQLSIGGSLGLALFPSASDNGDELLRMADVAMYAAKHEGRAFSWYQPELDKHSRRRLSLLTSLGPAIDNNELFLVYQPKIDVRDQALTGFEALLRWRHPVHGLIPPNDFIPYAETNEVIRPLTRWVLAESIRQGAAWLAAGHRFKMAVNISVRNLLDENLGSFIADCLREHALPAELLELEITESALMTRPAQAMGILQGLRDQGMSIAIDDFGTGYSSLAYLARLPVTTLKVDQAFVKDMVNSRADEQIVRSIIGLAHQCQLTVVAEGVEDAATLLALLNMGCDLAQGYHIARPMPVSDIEAWIATRLPTAPAAMTVPD